VVINYSFSSKIYLYDLDTGEIVEKNIKSQFTDNETPPMPSDQMNDISARVNYHLNELNFFGVRYDHFRDVYLRVHQDKREADARPVFYLTIISKKFEKLTEIRLAEDIKPYFEIAPEGVFFPVEPQNESQLCFQLLTLGNSNAEN
jgi:tRNA C32,U32 (ribose-2'-O)-methylase TrmJ